MDEWIRHGFEECGIKHLVSWEEFKEKGHYVIPNDPDWQKYDIGLRKFADDPEQNPISTPTGKLEFYSQVWPIISPMIRKTACSALDRKGRNP